MPGTSVADHYHFDTDPDPGRTLIRIRIRILALTIRIRAKKDSVEGNLSSTFFYKYTESFILGKKKTNLFSVFNGFRWFRIRNADPAQLLIRIRIQGN